MDGSPALREPRREGVGWAREEFGLGLPCYICTVS